MGDILAKTARTTIRLWRVEEAERLWDMLRRWEVARWLGAEPAAMTDPSQAAPRIEQMAARTERDPRYGFWAVEEDRTGLVAGTVLLVPLPNGDGEIEIGWYLHPDAWGRGLATESAAALLAKAFRDGHDEVWAVTRPDNGPSQRVCERVGLQPVGPTTRWYGVDMLSYRITRAQWTALG